MGKRVCPWWLGYWLISPIRGWLTHVDQVLGSYVREGMTVVEPGPGMGFFTLELARRVGAAGRVIAVDIQPRMVDKLKERLSAGGLLSRVDVRLVPPESMGLTDLAGRADFLLAFAMVHEMPSADSFFKQAAEVLKPGGTLLLAEPIFHVNKEKFAEELDQAASAGLCSLSHPVIRLSHAAVLKKL